MGEGAERKVHWGVWVWVVIIFGLLIAFIFSKHAGGGQKFGSVKSQIIIETTRQPVIRDYRPYVSIGRGALEETVGYLSGLGSRVAGYEGNRLSALYIYNHLREIGLEEVTMEPVRVASPIEKYARLTAGGRSWKIHCLYPNLVRTPTTPPEGIKGHAVYAGQGDYKEFNQKEIDGSVVFLEFNSDRSFVIARCLGAKAVVFIEPDYATRGEAERKILNAPVNLPRYWISAEDFQSIRELTDSFKRKVELTITARMDWEEVETWNIYGFIPGSELRDELIMIESYYDSMSIVPALSPGAEQASGVAVMLELARIFKENPPKRSVLFLATSPHCLALQGMAQFLFSHCRDKDFKERVDKPEVRALFGREISPKLALCLDLSSKTSRAGVFYAGMFALGAEFHLQRLFAPFAQKFVSEYSRDYLVWRAMEVLEGGGKPVLGTLARFCGNPDAKFTEDSFISRLREEGIGVLESEVKEALQKGVEVGLLRREKDRFTVLQRAYLENCVTPAQGKSWESFVPGLPAFDSEASVRARVPAMTLATVDDARILVDTPLDTVEKGYDFENILMQARVISAVLANALNDYRLFPEYRLDLKKSRMWSRALWGRVVEFNFRVNPYLPDAPVSDAVVVVGPPEDYKLKKHSFMGVRGYQVAVANERGEFFLPFVKSYVSVLEPYKLDPETGEITYAADRGQRGAQFFFELVIRMDAPLKRSTCVAFRCEPLDIYLPTDPRYLRPLEMINVLSAEDYEPQNYGYSTLRDPLAETVFVKPGERVKVLLGSSLFGIQYIAANSDPESPRGRGFSSIEYTLISPADTIPLREEISEVMSKRELPTYTFAEVYSRLSDSSRRNYTREQVRDELEAMAREGFLRKVVDGYIKYPMLAVAKDMYNRDEYWIKRLTKHSIRNERLEEELHRPARMAIDRAEKALTVMDHAGYIREIRKARGYEARAYPEVKSTALGSVYGIVFYFAILVPFAVFCERLFFGFADIKKQIAAASVIFVVVFFIMRYVHPAFFISRSPYVIFLAFVILAMAVFVGAFVVSKFNEQVSEMKRETSQIHQQDVGRISASMTAIVLGISNMRKRKVRTGLTTVTLILLTFTVLSFTSVKTVIAFTRIGRPNRPSYQGALIRSRNWRPLTEEALDYIMSEFRDTAIVSPRVWYYQLDKPLLRTVEFEGKSYRVSAGLGLGTKEILLSRKEFIIAGSWFEKDDELSCLVPKGVALQLGITEEDIGRKLTFLGQEFRIRGIFDSERAMEVYDLDGEFASPVDPEEAEGPGAELAQEETAASLQEQMIELKTYRHLPYDNVIIVPYDFLLDFDGLLASIAISPSENYEGGVQGLTTHIKEFLKRAALTVFVGEGDSVVAYSSIALSPVKGLSGLVIPIAMAALIVLSTMLGSVYERWREISIYSSVGLAPVHIGALFLAEACVYAIIGAVSGYLIGQVVASVLNYTGKLSGLVLNYSGFATVLATMLVIAVVLLSTLYPAVVATRSAVPDVRRRWKIPEPQGDLWRFDFPFTVATWQVPGMYMFLKDYFDGYKEESIGVFYTKGAEFYPAPDGKGCVISMDVWLAPFDLGISQKVELRASETEDSGITRLEVVIERVSGDYSDWKRMNRGFISLLRKQFLIWRTIPDAVRDRYSKQGEELLSERAKTVGG